MKKEKKKGKEGKRKEKKWGGSNKKEGVMS